MVFAIALGLLFSPSQTASFRDFGPYRANIPTPNSILGYAVGDRHTVFHDQERVVQSIATMGGDRAKIFTYGKSTEGRSLRYVAISAPENIARLEEIRQKHLQLSQVKSESEAKAVTQELPAIVWINECIHGDETASFESAMELIYNLVASENTTITDALKNVIVIVNPSYNPDGHERYVVAYNSIPNGDFGRGAYDSAIPSAFLGRANHYRFDMNRDRIALSQVESQQEVRAFLSWNPQVYVDQHGQVETYFFPPVQQSINPNIGRDRYTKWTETFGRATAKAFDAKGWTYYIRDQFDLYNACYLDSHTSLMGAIGMTHETDGGRVMGSERSDGTELTMRDGAEKHLVAAIAVIGSAAEKSSELLASFAEFKIDAMTGKHAGDFQRVVLEGEPRELERFAQHLDRFGIESRIASKGWKQKDSHDLWSDWSGEKEFPAGSLIVDMNQSQGPLAKALLESKSDFEPEFVERQKELIRKLEGETDKSEIDWFEFYDSTAWSLPLAYQLSAWWCESRPKVSGLEPFSMVEGFESSSVGYWLDYRDESDILAVFDLMQLGVNVAMNSQSFVVGGVDVPKSSFVFLKTRNGDGLDEKLEQVSLKRGVAFKSLSTSYPDEGRHGPGSGQMYSLRPTKLGVVFGSSGQLNGGSLWFTLEKVFQIPFRKLSTNGVSGALSGLTTIVVPDGVRLNRTPEIEAWLKDGGRIVSLSGDGFETGEEANIKPSTYSLPGSIYLANLNLDSFIGSGYRRSEVAIPVEGSGFNSAGDNDVLSIIEREDRKNLLSGWEFESSESDVVDTSWISITQVGRGSVVVFRFDPTYRAQWPGLHKLLLNSMILGQTR